MTLEEAKRFYFDYNGFSFHMGREEPSRYTSFRLLEIGRDTLRCWDEELLKWCFEMMHTEPDRAWVYHGDILQIVRRGNCDGERFLTDLLSEMEKMADSDIHVITLVIENMAGRNEAMSDGGVFLFRNYPSLYGRMKEVTESLIASGIKTGETDERFMRAAAGFRSACRRWH